jgi:hypothetical protein
MTIPDDAKQKIEAYLGKLSAQLRGFNAPQVAEIVAELRSHILDKLAAGGETTAAPVDSILAALGSAEELANQYITDTLLARAEGSRSPLRMLDGLFRWATLSFAGFFVLFASVFGYFFGVVFILVAVFKVIHPQTAGLWLLPDGTGDSEFSFRMGFGSVPAGRDLLGWWIVPLGLLAGCALITLTTRFALWCVRQYRKSNALPRS